MKKLLVSAAVILAALLIAVPSASATPKATIARFDRRTGFGTTQSGGTLNSTTTNTVDGKGNISVQTASDCTSCDEQGFVSWVMSAPLTTGGTITVKADFHYHGKSVPHHANFNTIKLLACQPSIGCLVDAVNADHASKLQVTGTFQPGDVLIQVIMFSELNAPAEMASARVRLDKITLTG